MSLLDRVRDCAGYDLAGYVPFRVEGAEVGRIRRDVVDLFRPYDEVLAVSETGIDFISRYRTVDARTKALSLILEDLRTRGHVPGWRDEPYPVGVGFNQPVLLEMERAAVPLFGVRGYGVHMNGWLIRGGQMHMWIAKRSMTKPTGPGKLDQMVAGGQPTGLSLRDNMIKECGEEAGLPFEIAKNVQPVGTISYCTERSEGLRQDVLFNFDLEVPDDFEPVNVDGEVEAFMLWPIDEIIARLSNTDDFKFNSALVIIDFLIRRGFIEADDPDYADIVAGLHA